MICINLEWIMEKDRMLPIEDQIEILKEAILSVTVATDEEAKNEATEVVLYLNRQGLEIYYI